MRGPSSNLLTRASFLLTVCGIVWLVERQSDAQINEPGSFVIERFSDAQFALYERQLNALLKTRRDEEKLFVNQVVARVKEGKLPPKLVQTSYGWVRNKRPGTKYPFVFFERVLRIQARKAELADVVPDFDYRIYRKVLTPTR